MNKLEVIPVHSKCIELWRLFSDVRRVFLITKSMKLNVTFVYVISFKSAASNVIKYAVLFMSQITLLKFRTLDKEITPNFAWEFGGVINGLKILKFE